MRVRGKTKDTAFFRGFEMKQLVVSVFMGGLAVCLLAQEKGLIFGHRAGRKEFEENTLEAFQESYAKGTRGFETDFRLTQDGELVILHNDSVNEIYDGKGAVEEMTAGQIRQLKSKRNHRHLPFLNEFLDFLADKPNMYVEFEMKTSNKKYYPDSAIAAYCDKLCKAALAKKPQGSVYVFTSFDPRPLVYIGQHYPNAERLYIFGTGLSPEIVNKAKALGIRRIGCIASKTTRAAVDEAHKANMIVSCWPGNDVKDYLLMYGLGVDVMCSDVPVQMNTWKKAAGL